MKPFKLMFCTIALVLTGCISWVFAKSPFVDLPEGEYHLDLSHASIVWKVSHLGLSNYVARFTDFDATIDYQPDNIEKSSVSVSIDLYGVRVRARSRRSAERCLVAAVEAVSVAARPASPRPLRRRGRCPPPWGRRRSRPLRRRSRPWRRC